MKQTSRILSFFALPTLVFLIHLITVGLSNLYVHFPHIDIPFHYAGGFAIAFTSVQILTYLQEECPHQPVIEELERLRVA